MKPNLLQRIGGAITAAGWSWSGGYTGGAGGWGGSKFNGATVYPSLAGLDHATLRAKMRKAHWESPDARAIEGRIVNSTINWGLMLKASPAWDIIDPEDKITPEARRAWKKKVQTLYGLWMNSTDPDAAKKKTGYQLQGFTFGNKIREGETFIICRYSKDARLLNPLQLQFVNPDQIKDPMDGAMLAAVLARGNHIVDGVEIDDAGQEIAIFVWSGPADVPDSHAVAFCDHVHADPEVRPEVAQTVFPSPCARRRGGAGPRDPAPGARRPRAAEDHGLQAGRARGRRHQCHFRDKGRTGARTRAHRRRSPLRSPARRSRGRTTRRTG